MPFKTAQILLDELRLRTQELSDEELECLRDLFIVEYQRRLLNQNSPAAIRDALLTQTSTPKISEAPPKDDTEDEHEESVTQTLEHTFGHLDQEMLLLIKHKIQQALP